MLKIWKNTIIQLINLKICSNRRERNDKIMKKATLYLLMISLIGMLEVPVHAADVYADESTELYSFDFKLIKLRETLCYSVVKIHYYTEMNKFRQQVYVICLEVKLLIR